MRRAGHLAAPKNPVGGVSVATFIPRESAPKFSVIPTASSALMG